MRRVLMVSPHFPPDSSAAAHRVRLLAPYLGAHGWTPTILTVDPRDHEGGIEPALATLVPPTIDVFRVRAWSPEWTRPIGFGDLGLRSYVGLRAACHRILMSGTFDALFVTIYPAYPALLGPSLRRRFGVKFVLDYQDPWVGSWGDTVGGGPAGAPDLRSRLSRFAGTRLEPRAVQYADAITAVSQGTYDEIAARIPAARRAIHAVLPLGWDRADMACLTNVSTTTYFEPHGDVVNLAYVGTILPKGVDTLRALLLALARLRDMDREAYARLRLWFLGTSNQFAPDAPSRVMPIAEELGVAANVKEVAPRIPYADALTALKEAHGVLLLGSTEAHYTASKLFPALVSDRPILAAFHESSSVVEILKRVGGSTPVRIVTFGEAGPGSPELVECLARHLGAMTRQPARSAGYDLGPIADTSAASLAATLCGVFDAVCA